MTDDDVVQQGNRAAVNQFGRPMHPKPVPAPGTTGPSGPSGPTLPTGPTSPSGPSGPTSPTGPGPSGPTGPIPDDEMIDRYSPFRITRDCGEAVWLAEHSRLGSPIPLDQQKKSYAAVKSWSAQALAFAVKETEAGKTANGQNNEFNLFVADGSGAASYPSWKAGATEWYRRLSDPAYKGGVYWPEDASCEKIVVVFQGGPGCYSSKGATCAHGETWKPCQGGSASNNSIELSVQQFIARCNSYMGHPQETPWTPVVNGAGCTPTTPPPSGSNPYKTERDVLNMLSNNNPQSYISFGYAERNPGQPIYKYGKGHMTAAVQGDDIHPGIDVWMPDETPVGSLFDGMVVCVGSAGNPMWGQGCGYFSDDNGGIGNITVLHDVTAPIGGKQRQLKLTYGHMSSSAVKVGDRVKTGQIIGRSGTAAVWHHIHFDVVCSANELNNPQIWNNPGEYHLVDPLPTILNAASATAPPPTGSLVFGRVPKPTWTDRIIPDANNIAWDNLGQRKVLGVTLHRQQGTNWGTDGWFRMMWQSNGQPGGGQLGLTDFGIDHNSGETLQWTDYLGKGRAGVSANRAGWASGPWQHGSPEGVAFVNKYGVNAINRDRVSLEVSGFYGDPISNAALDKLALIIAWLADGVEIPWDSFPINPADGLDFVGQHHDYQNNKPCAGNVLIAALPELTKRAKAIMKTAQVG